PLVCKGSNGQPCRIEPRWQEVERFMSSNFPMTIDGRAVAAAATLAVRNPATAAVFAQAPDASAADLDAAVAAATRAFPAWRDTAIAERKACLVKATEAIEAHADELAALFVKEQGRP